MSAFLAGLSFLMGASCAYYRNTLFSASLENNVIVMFSVGASTTYLWLLLRKHLPGFNTGGKARPREYNNPELD